MDNGEGNGPGSSRKTVRLNRFILPVVHPVVELGILSEKKKSITEGRKAARTNKKKKKRAAHLAQVLDPPLASETGDKPHPYKNLSLHKLILASQ